MAAGPLVLWNHRSIQILVLLSLGLQLVLFVFAGIRRRQNLPVRRFLLWLAYLMADSTAVYALGHLSFSSTVRGHQLVAFWAPFLLLHLGGPDNITAYALQDNQLWLRHLTVLVVQVLGAGYVLKKHIAVAGGHDGNFLLVASILMFTVGLVKYGERTWSLRCSTMESIGASLKMKRPAIHKHYHPQDGATEEEFHLRRAHSLFHVCKRTMVDSSVVEEDSMDSLDSTDGLEEYTSKLIQGVELWTLMEIELSLMYDVLYTKAAVVHTFPGYLIRVLSPLTVATSLLLFRFTAKDDHTRSDVAITYVLLGGAVFMETTSLLNALASSWTFAFLSTTSWSWLRYTTLCNERWDKLRRVIVRLHDLVKGRVAGNSRYKSRRWSYTIGQYNLLHFCTRPADTPLTSPLLGRLARALKLDEWWNRKHYSATVEMTDVIRRHIAVYMSQLYSKGRFNTDMLGKKWGEYPLDRRGLYRGVLKDSLGVEFQEGIIIWHIATEVFLTKSEKAKAIDATPIVHAIRVMSDYLMFLLVERPYMLPGQPQKRLYQRTCERLVTMRSADPRYPSRARVVKDLFRMSDAPHSSISRVAEREELANNLYDAYEDREFSLLAPRLTHMARLAKELLEKEKDGTTNSLNLVLDVWMDILVYASNKCSRESHAQKLNSGGELTTIVWLMAEYIYQASVAQRDDVV
ncbi:uncharacterized protein [Aegilops tauschii subsp. strangulata]|uniref:DUF4220 domain-containing protein n=1 Tax=Aegilops tauschii subsp. strangulata TaxID=200361 RepID=A0A453ABU1_AEGTS|nr:uncharacterized protein LOC109759722 [Aegilops tauschii subsp. strangulata]